MENPRSAQGEDQNQRFVGLGTRISDSLAQLDHFQRQYTEIAADLANMIARGSLLAVRIGPGFLLRELFLLNPQLEFYGSESSPSMLGVAQKNLAGYPVKFVLENITNSIFDSESFDLVTATSQISAWAHPTQPLREIHRLLKPGCSAYLYEMNPDMDLSEFKPQIATNFSTAPLVWRFLARRFLRRQQKRSIPVPRLHDILMRSIFANQYAIHPISLNNLPIWLRIDLKKP